MKTISWFEHESVMVRMERHTKRLFVLCVVMFAALIGSNVIWIVKMWP